MKWAYELDPENAEINHLIGAFFRSIGLYEVALDLYERALEIDPKPMEFDLWYELLADCYSLLGRFEEAATISRKALEIQPSWVLYLSDAWQSIMLEQFQEAERQIVEAEKLAPDSPTLQRAFIRCSRESRESS
jgi:tetratricopeptide (TPR) repeat protein